MVSALSLDIVDEIYPTKVLITGGYASDLLSHVMSKAEPGNVWVTMQGHPNIVAVAVLIELSAVIVAGGVIPETDTLRKAHEEGIALFTTPLSTYEICGKLYSKGINNA